MRIAARTSTQAQTRQTRCVMTEFFTMIVLAGTFEGRVVAKIQTRNARSAVLRDIGESTGAYWGSPLF
jgi:hypothetical protein